MLWHTDWMHWIYIHTHTHTHTHTLAHSGQISTANAIVFSTRPLNVLVRCLYVMLCALCPPLLSEGTFSSWLAPRRRRHDSVTLPLSQYWARYLTLSLSLSPYVYVCMYVCSSLLGGFNSFSINSTSNINGITLLRILIIFVLFSSLLHRNCPLLSVHINNIIDMILTRIEILDSSLTFLLFPMIISWHVWSVWFTSKRSIRDLPYSIFLDSVLMKWYKTNDEIFVNIQQFLTSTRVLNDPIRILPTIFFYMATISSLENK